MASSTINIYLDVNRIRNFASAKRERLQLLKLSYDNVFICGDINVGGWGDLVGKELSVLFFDLFWGLLII